MFLSKEIISPKTGTSNKKNHIAASRNKKSPAELFIYSTRLGLWAKTGLNRRHPACKAGALPTELFALKFAERTMRLTFLSIHGKIDRHL